MDTLVSERVLLRMFRESDLDAYAEMCGDPDVMRYLGDGHPLTRAEAWRNMAIVLGHWQLARLRPLGRRGAGDRAPGRPGRLLAVRRVGPASKSAGRSAAGSGAAAMPPRPALTALDHAFTTLGQTHVISLIQPENSRSIAVALRLGMRMEGSTEVMGQSVLMYGIDRRSTVPYEPRPRRRVPDDRAPEHGFEKYDDFTEFGLPAAKVSLLY